MAVISETVNFDILEKKSDGTFKKKHPETKASQVLFEDASNNFTALNIEGAMEELFTNVSNGKDLVSGAIIGVDNNVVIPTNPTFSDLGSAISEISTGKKWMGGSEFINKKTQEYTFRFMNGYTTTSGYYIEVVQDFGFEPSMIVAHSVGNAHPLVVTYTKDPLVVFSSSYNLTTKNSSIQPYQVSDGIYVSRYGFRLPYSYGNMAWLAIE